MNLTNKWSGHIAIKNNNNNVQYILHKENYEFFYCDIIFKTIKHSPHKKPNLITVM